MCIRTYMISTSRSRSGFMPEAFLLFRSRLCTEYTGPISLFPPAIRNLPLGFLPRAAREEPIDLKDTLFCGAESELRTKYVQSTVQYICQIQWNRLNGAQRRFRGELRKYEK
ncbi:hypothetical protein, variant [Blastomyces gilchristii SLH14081]|uniref:Uncharacterized protein n=1 Tax=Blastomyces gilchristii (strain SLH14081) TaxID=559298 RepID=A0A179UCV7_BLAGS|nr:uncharacterized protein BDBG_16487 [Blastomyces gilchristii SLH14081]XP_031576826.1 hypothetical protein, variant [Blastomyces gilchristii SLH14081]OAT05670.1 hypothetical protein BDBG_16487 [Blastomyces gilchristii SLH14081]OAT05671.1 hypothetical protein, variant [Blastomyces gilchristii SLH14081]